MSLLRRFFFVAFVLFVVPKATRAEPRISPLAKEPDWEELAKFQNTITREEFTRLLDGVYAPDGAWQPFITLRADSALIATDKPDAPFTLRFAAAEPPPKAPPRYWKPASARRPASTEQPLRGVSIALDPGHLGGSWAKMEERWFQIGGGGTQPVTEGDMTLRVAKLLAARLRALGAEVSLVRDAARPVTSLRPGDLRKAAREELRREGLQGIRETYSGPADPLKEDSIQWHSELLFYRTAEIRARARLVNQKLRPDLVLCLHFNAEEWGDPAKPRFVESNHLHVLVNGCYSAAELAFDDIRFGMLEKLLGRTYAEALPAAEHVAAQLARDTGLPPYEYTRGNARRTGSNPYVWARNLLANRLYDCPVIYIEPYVMNSEAVWRRVQMGDYAGERMVDGTMRKSIYREYADAVAAGLASYYRDAEAQR